MDKGKKQAEFFDCRDMHVNLAQSPHAMGDPWTFFASGITFYSLFFYAFFQSIWAKKYFFSDKIAAKKMVCFDLKMGQNNFFIKIRPDLNMTGSVEIENTSRIFSQRFFLKISLYDANQVLLRKISPFTESTMESLKKKDHITMDKASFRLGPKEKKRVFFYDYLKNPWKKALDPKKIKSFTVEIESDPTTRYGREIFIKGHKNLSSLLNTYYCYWPRILFLIVFSFLLGYFSETNTKKSQAIEAPSL